MARLAILLLVLLSSAFGASKRVLYVTHSAGYRHDSLPVSAEVLRQLGRSADYDLTWTEDLSYITRERLSEFDALFFYTSGELALSSDQKAALLDFVRAGKGFGGAHSATDTLYSWAEYGDLIGGYFDGHPWVQRAGIDVEDASHPASAPVAPRWEIVEEFYQFRAFSRDRVRVLMTLDTDTVNLNAPGVNRTCAQPTADWSSGLRIPSMKTVPVNQSSGPRPLCPPLLVNLILEFLSSAGPCSSPNAHFWPVPTVGEVRKRARTHRRRQFLNP